MSLLQAIILGIIQGLTEFLPVSSSAHLVITPYLLNWKLDPQFAFTFDVLVQDGTLVAVILYFWKDLWQIAKAFVLGLVQRKPFADEQSRLGWYLILATIPAGLFGLFVKPYVEAAFASAIATALFLFVTAAFLLTAERWGKRSRDLSHFDWKDALVMGLFQALAIFPGVSRSGSTITGGMLRQLDRRSAARFSFLMSVPVMIAAGALETVDALQMPGFISALPVILAGFLAAGVVGFLSIHWLLSFLQKRSLTAFAIYCVAFGALTLVVALLR
ncbi:MAG: undecaprenyl-diphosphatase UppP [Anaerolineae bacterium]|nr:undecaprenyl-diphosphatase UppP [Anaerolineae bacterium]